VNLLINFMFTKIKITLSKILSKLNTVKLIEKEIIENQKRLNEIEYKIREEYDEGSPYIAHEAIEIEKYNKILDFKRQHKLDRRNGWTSRFIWSILAPIIVALSVSLLFNILIKK